MVYVIYGVAIILCLSISRLNGFKIKNDFFYNNRFCFCWFLLCISSLNYSPSIIQYTIRFIAIFCTLIASMVFFLENGIELKGKMSTNILLLFIMLCMISTVYSVHKLETFIKSIEILCTFLILFILVKKDNSCGNVFFKLYTLTMRVISLLVAGAVFGFVIAPSSFSTTTGGILGIQLSEGLLGANGSGAAGIFLLIYLLNNKNIRYRKVLFVIDLIDIFFSQARTSIIIFCALVGIYFFLERRKFKLAFAITIISVFAYQYSDLILEYFYRGSNIENIKTMTGRIKMWDVAKTYISAKPLLGYGYGAGGYQVSSLFNMSHLHSGIYELLMGVGYVGGALMALVIICTICNLLESIIKKGFNANIIEIMLMVSLLIRTYTSLGIGGWNTYEFMIWFLLVFSLCYSSSYKGLKEEIICYSLLFRRSSRR